MNNHKWSIAEDEWVRQNYKAYSSYAELSDALSKEFGAERTYNSVKGHMLRTLNLNIGRTKGKPYTVEEKFFLLQNAATMPYSELAKEMYSRFGREASKTAIAHFMCDIMQKPRCGRNTTFQKGERIGKVNAIGSEYVSQSGYTLVKVADTGIKNADWKTKQQVMWKKYYGEKANGIVVFLNADRSDFSKENLYCLNRKTHLTMCNNKWYTTDKELTLTAIRWCELQGTIKGIEKEAKFPQ